MDYKWKVLTVTTLATFMSNLDAGIIVVGLPTVVADLGTTLFLGIWLITGYRLMLTIFLVTIGRITDIVGRVKLYNAGFAMFTLGSLLCAISPNAELLIAFRLVQGLGGAFLVGNSVAIVTDSFPTSELGTAVGVNQVGQQAGGLAGFTLSGVMIGLFGWRSIFWLNVPIGLFGTVWCYRRLKELYVKTGGQRFDYAGAITFSCAITLLLVALTGNSGLLYIQGFYCVSLVLFVAFLMIEQRKTQPLLDLSLFKIHSFSVGNVANMLNYLSYTGLAFLLTLYLQLVRGYGPLEAGLLLIPVNAAFIVGAPLGGILADRYGRRLLAAIGLVIMSIALFMYANFSSQTSLVFVGFAMLLAGAGEGLFRSPNTSSIMGSLPANRRGVGNGIRTTINQTCTAVSTPLAMSLMTMMIPYEKLARIIQSGTSSVGGASGMASALSFAFYVLAVVNTLAIATCLFREQKKADETHLVKE